MQRDIVLVPCYERPEFTRSCLQYLSRTRGIDDKEVWLWQDQHAYEDFNVFDGPVSNMQSNVDLGSKLFPNRFMYVVKNAEDCSNTTYGNSENLIAGLRAAYRSDIERIFLVEDDIIVAPDFFSWHEAVLEEPGVFVSCSTALSKSAHFQINGPLAMDETYQDPAAYYLAEGPYSSHAVAFKRDNLGQLLSWFASEDRKWAPGYEQDLLTQQFMHVTHQKSAWPFMPRAYNVGFYSYHINTGRKFHGTLEQKSLDLERTIKDPQKLKEMSANNSSVTPLPEHWPIRLEPVRNVQRLR